VQRLQAFENDQFDQGANLHTGRAMVASVARHLGLDQHLILQKLPQGAAVLPVARAQETVKTFALDTRMPTQREQSLAVSNVWWFAAAIVLVAGVLFFFPQLKGLGQRINLGSTSAVLEPTKQVPDLPADGAQSQAVAVQPLGIVAQSISQAVTASAASAASPVLEAPTSGAAPIIVFKARASSWVEVADAKGVVLLRRTLATAESAQVNGELPLSVVVGRADHTDVLVRGQAFSLVPFAQDNVARFKVP
jgi:cytoskeleton protein RodZ